MAPSTRSQTATAKRTATSPKAAKPERVRKPAASSTKKASGVGKMKASATKTKKKATKSSAAKKPVEYDVQAFRDKVNETLWGKYIEFWTPETFGDAEIEVMPRVKSKPRNKYNGDAALI